MDKNFHEISSVLRIPSQFRNNNHIDYLMRLTQDVQFFTKISTEQQSNEVHRECCKVMNLEKYSAEDFIFNFGEKGDKFYIILNGSVSVKVPARRKYVVSKAAVNKIENILEAETGKSSDSDEILDNLEEENLTARKRDGLVKINVNDVISSLKGQMAINEMGDEKSVILSNEEKYLLNLFKRKVKEEQRILMNAVKYSQTETLELEFDDFNEIAILFAGASFGELALISDGRRSATIQSRENSSFLVLNKSDFTKILGDIAEKRVTSLVQFLQKVPYLHSRSKSSLLRISYYFQSRKFKKDQRIYKEADPIDGVYLIKEGEVTITKKKSQITNTLPFFTSTPTGSNLRIQRKSNPMVNVKIIIKSMYEGFGGYELISQQDSRVYSCTCSSATCELLFIPKTAFMSRIPHLDLFREFIINEHERLMERFFKMNNSASPVEHVERSTSSFAVRIKSPLLHSPIKSTLKVSGFATRNSIVKTRNLAFRKLSKKEVDEAVNGRKTLMKKYGSKININSSFSSIPHHPSNQSFHISKLFLHAKNGS